MMLNVGGCCSAAASGDKWILPYLIQRVIAALDAVVVTHPDADHTNGILELLEMIGEQKTALRIRHLFLPVWMKGSEKENPFILAAQKAGIMVEYLKKGDEIRAGELTVSVLHPGAGEDYTGEENGNPMISFPYTMSAIECTVASLDDTVHKIMKKDFSRQAESLKTCTGCDFRFYCQNK